MKPNKFLSTEFVSAALNELKRLAQQIESEGAFAHPLNYTIDELERMKLLHNKLLYVMTLSGEIELEYFIMQYYLDSECGQILIESLNDVKKKS